MIRACRRNKKKERNNYDKFPLVVDIPLHFALLSSSSSHFSVLAFVGVIKVKPLKKNSNISMCGRRTSFNLTSTTSPIRNVRLKLNVHWRREVLFFGGIKWHLIDVDWLLVRARRSSRRKVKEHASLQYIENWNDETMKEETRRAEIFSFSQPSWRYFITGMLFCFVNETTTVASEHFPLISFN